MAKVTKHAIVGTVRWVPLSGGRIQLLDGWADKNIVTVHIPQLKGVPTYGGVLDGDIPFFKGAAAQLKAAFEEIEEKGLLKDIIFWGGSFNPRMVRGSTRTPSNHAFGTAFDINPQQNGLGVTPPPVGAYGSVRRLAPIFKKYGFFWGGDYRRRKDGMHEEVQRLLSASEIEALRAGGVVVHRPVIGKPVTQNPVAVPQNSVIIVHGDQPVRVHAEKRGDAHWGEVRKILSAAGVEITREGTWGDESPVLYVK